MANISLGERANHAWHILGKVLLKRSKVRSKPCWLSVLESSLKLHVRLDQGKVLDEAVDWRLNETCRALAQPAEESEHAPVERLEQGDVPEATG